MHTEIHVEIHLDFFTQGKIIHLPDLLRLVVNYITRSWINVKNY